MTSVAVLTDTTSDNLFEIMTKAYDSISDTAFETASICSSNGLDVMELIGDSDDEDSEMDTEQPNVDSDEEILDDVDDMTTANSESYLDDDCSMHQQ